MADDQDQVDAPPATMLCMARSSRFPPHMMVLLVLAALLLAAPRPTRSLSHGDAAALQPVLTFCSVHGQSPNLTSSFSAAVTSGDDFAAFVAAVCAGVHGAADMSHNMSSHVAGKLMYGVAQCRPDVPAADCAACLAAASSRLVAGSSAACAVWYDACFLRYNDRDPSRFNEDEYMAAVFNATRAVPQHRNGKAVVRRLLAVLGNTTTSSHGCRGVGAGTAAARGGGMVYGLTRCAAGTSCDDCRRCLRRAVAAVGRAYNGSAGMQVLRLSCMARYESHPFYNGRSLQTAAVRSGASSTVSSAPPPSSRFGAIGSGGATINSPGGGSSPIIPPATTIGQNGNGTAVAPTAPPAVLALPRVLPAPIPTQGSSMEHRSPSLSHEMETQKTHKVPIMLIIPIATGVVVAIVILVLIWHRRRKPLVQLGHVEEPDGMQGKKIYDQKDEQLGMEEEDMDGDITTCQSYSYQVLEAATCHFSNRNKLGSGGFGTVYKGTLENGKEVAVKKLRDSKRNLQELEREIYIVANLCHKNLVRFLGYCLEDEGKFLVYEYVPNNSLEKFWYKACFHSQKLEWDAWFNIIKGVARGLQFLHNKGIIHRDLKPHNVLLDENFNPKIADFDLMRMYNKEKTHESTEKIAGTFGYMAPECTSGRKFLLSIKSDVYSYGVLVLEIITGHKIYTFEGQNSEGLVEYVWKHWTEKRAGDIIDSDLGVDGQEHALRQALRCVHVALLCVQSDRARRPTMGQVLAMLSNDDGIMELQEPSLPGYVVFRATAVSGPVRLSCLGCR